MALDKARGPCYYMTMKGNNPDGTAQSHGRGRHYKMEVHIMEIVELRKLYKSLEACDNFSLMVAETKNIATSMDYYNRKVSYHDFDKAQCALAIIERLYDKRDFDRAHPDPETAALYADWDAAYRKELYKELMKPIK